MNTTRDIIRFVLLAEDVGIIGVDTKKEIIDFLEFLVEDDPFTDCEAKSDRQEYSMTHTVEDEPKLAGWFSKLPDVVKILVGCARELVYWHDKSGSEWFTSIQEEVIIKNGARKNLVEAVGKYNSWIAPLQENEDD